MKECFLAISLLVSFCGISQPFKIVFGGGISNYSGDIQQKNFTLQQSRSVFALGATYSLSNHFLLRTDFSFASIGADDKKGGNPDTEGRNLNFKSKIFDFALLAEYNLLNIEYTNWTPYVFAGAGLYSFNPYTYDARGVKVMLAPLRTEGQGLTAFPDRKPYKTTQLNIPAGMGIKYALSENIHVGGEFGIRKLFTDYLDDVSTNYVDENLLLNAYGERTVEMAFRGDELSHNSYGYPHQGAQRGSPKYKDYYYFAQLRLSIRLNWFESWNSGGSKGYGCPSNVW